MEINKDVIIVGAGINGLCTAFFLAQKGVSVCLIDSRGPGNQHSSSYGNHRLIHPHADTDTYSAIGGAYQSLKLWRSLLAEIGVVGFVATGVLAATRSDKLSYPRNGIGIRSLSRKEIVELIPMMADGPISGAIYYEKFGVLMASEILTALHRYLASCGQVRFLVDHVVAIDSFSGSIETQEGISISGQAIVVAAGAGASKLLGNSLGDVSALADLFQTQLCHVLHCFHPACHHAGSESAWADLGVGDLWGMQPIGGHMLKLGCGDLTEPFDQGVIAKPASEIARRILDAYTTSFPNFSGCIASTVESRQWTKIAVEKPYLVRDKAIIVTSDDGAGFKFAPLTASRICNEVTL